MISIDTMKFRTADMIGEEFPLVFWRGNGRIVASDDESISLLVRGVRVDLTWDRLAVTWSRFLQNHTMTVDELGGGADAVGIVSLFAHHPGRRALHARGRRPHHARGDRGRAGAPVRRHVGAHVVGSLAAQDPRRLSARPFAATPLRP